jgi:hypothetical protein
MENARATISARFYRIWYSVSGIFSLLVVASATDQSSTPAIISKENKQYMKKEKRKAIREDRGVCGQVHRKWSVPTLLIQSPHSLV